MAAQRGSSSKPSGSQLPSSPLLPASQPKRPKKRVVICPICDEPVEDASSKKRGHDAIFCEGACQEWLHRQCAGLSKVNFDSAKSSNLPFLCPCCLLTAKSKELSLLKDTVDKLVADLSDLKSICSSFVGNNRAPATNTEASASRHAQAPPVPPVSTSHTQSSNPVNATTTKVIDRKYNVVVFGINELPSGTSRFARDKHDFSNLSSLFSGLEHDSDHSSTIRDCRRLGKFTKGEQSCRPLLVTLNSTADVRSILHCHNNSSNTSVSIKPDLSAADRRANAILLKARWDLINSGIDRKCIKIRGANLLVNGKHYGKVLGSTFILASSATQSTTNTTCISSASLPISSQPNVANLSSPPSNAASVDTIPPIIAANSSTSGHISTATSAAQSASAATCPPSGPK